MPRTASRRPRARAAPLLDLDRDLGGRLDGERYRAARVALVVPVLQLARGSWAGGEISAAGPDQLGLLLVDGAIAREVVLADTISTELFGPGDVIRPWGARGSPHLLRHDVRWQVLADARLAVLARGFGVTVARYPEINATLLERLDRRAERVATLKAIASLNSIERRLLSLFRHLAEDWGRMTADGIVVPLRLSHRLIGELVGARRPSVSSAAGRLSRDGKLMRRVDGSWLLADPPQ